MGLAAAWIAGSSPAMTKERNERTETKKEAERRQALILYPPHHRVRLCPGEGAARLPAFHHGSRQRESSSLGLSFRPGFLGRGLHGRYPPSPVPVQGSTSHPGRNAGRHDAQAAREGTANPPAG